MQLVLVRHGESTWNLQRRLQGQTHAVPLTPVGRKQAAQAAEHVAALVGSARVSLVSSDQLRAVETAALIGQRLGLVATTTPLAREQALGTLEGTSYDDLVAEEAPPGVDISEARWGGGESVADVYARCGELLDLLYAQGSEAVVLVSHGDLLRILLARLERRGHRNVEWVAIGNGAVLERAL